LALEQLIQVSPKGLPTISDEKIDIETSSMSVIQTTSTPSSGVFDLSAFDSFGAFGSTPIRSTSIGK